MDLHSLPATLAARKGTYAYRLCGKSAKVPESPPAGLPGIVRSLREVPACTMIAWLARIAPSS